MGTICGQRLREHRAAAGLSQRDLARLSGVSRATILRAENDRHRAYGITAQALANALGISVAALRCHEADGEAGLHPAHPPNGGEAPAPADEAAA